MSLLVADDAGSVGANFVPDWLVQWDESVITLNKSSTQVVLKTCTAWWAMSKTMAVLFDPIAGVTRQLDYFK